MLKNYYPPEKIFSANTTKKILKRAFLNILKLKKEKKYQNLKE